MATSRKPYTGLMTSDTGDRDWGKPLAFDVDILEASAGLSALRVTPAAVDLATNVGTSLLVAVAPGSYKTPSGAAVYYWGTGVSPLLMPASSATFVWLNAAGAPASGAVYPSTGFYVPLATVFTDAATVTVVADARVMVSGISPALTAPAAASVGATYTAAEQAILQSLLDAVRKLINGT